MVKEAPFVRLALAACLGMAPLLATAAEPGTDLRSVVQSTLDTNPELRAQLDAFHASIEDRREVFGRYLPSIDLSASVGQADREYDSRGYYTDSTGSASLNRELSLQRAVSVREFLIQQGVDRAIIAVAGAGADRPVASNNTAEGRAENRRVELHINRSE